MTNKKLLAGIFGTLLVFSFVLADCAHRSGGGNSEPKLAEWAGTWNALDQYLDDTAFDGLWDDAVTAIKAAKPATVVDAANLKAMLKEMWKTDFKSCTIEGNTMKIYNSPNVAGSPAASMTYVYDGIHTVDGQECFKFTGDTVGQFKYLLLRPTHQDAPDAMLHFHLKYSAMSFEAATSNPNWISTVTLSSTPIDKIVEDLAEVPWAMLADMF
jgi:Zn/Cd-binding protein ZinT